MLSSVIIYLLPTYFTRYRISHLETKKNIRKSTTYFEDLNNDDRDEKIVVYENSLGNSSFEVHTADGNLIDQWNFNGRHPSKNWELWFADYNNDEFDEIIHFIHRNDSIFMIVTKPMSFDKYKPKEIFIESLENKNEDNSISTAVFGTRINGKSSNTELFFSLNGGFSGNPRNAYLYSFQNDSVIKSPHLTNQSRIYHIEDLDGDGRYDILLANYAAGNNIDPSYTTKSDYHAWLTVLEDNLKFKFDPIEIPSQFSSVHSIPIKNASDNFDIVTRINSKNPTKFPNRLMLYSSNGILKKEHILDVGLYFVHPVHHNQNILLHNMRTGLIQILNRDFETLFTTSIVAKSYLFPLDIEENGHPNWIEIHPDKSTVTVYEQDFKEAISLAIPGGGFVNLKPDLKKNGVGANDLFFRDGNDYYLYSYDKNPLYYLKYLTYITIFLLMYGLVWLIRKGVKIKMEKQHAIENEIAALQIKNINNQINPHFVFNAINTISEMTLMEDKFEADSFISKFSKFMRGTLEHSDKITTTLDSELSYVENFIKLQQQRFKNRFAYELSVDSNVIVSSKVPKHMVFCYVENAIKHGLSHKKENGLLKIHISQDHEYKTIVIEDNGIGIQNGKRDRKDSTGNGLKIMNHVFELFYKLYKKKIDHEIVELYNQQGKKSGLRVTLKMAA